MILNFIEETKRFFIGLFAIVYHYTYHFPFFMHDSGKKAITFECLLAQIQNQNRSILYRTAIHLRSNKWLYVESIRYQGQLSRVGQVGHGPPNYLW